MTSGQEMTLSQFVESKWFKLAWRGAVILSPLVFSIGLWFLNDIKNEAASARAAAALVKDQVSEVNQTQQERANLADQRAKDADLFQDYVKGEIADVKAGQLRTADTLGVVRESTARILGMVEQMQKSQDVAQGSLRIMPR